MSMDMDTPQYAPETFERQYVRPRAGRTLVCGSYVTPGKVDRRMRYGDAVGVDMRPGLGVDVVADLEQPHPELGLFDHVECCSVIEHVRRPWLLAANVEAMMPAGATLHFSAPFIWRPHDYPSDYWRVTIDALPVLFPRIDWRVRLYGSEFLISGDKKLPGVKLGHSKFPYYARTEVYGFGVRQ
jgi:hypothetical protein